MNWPSSKYVEFEGQRKNIFFVKAHTVDQLLSYLRETEQHKGWVFRGQPDYSWPLIPSLFRNMNNPHLMGIADRHLEKFKVHVRGRVSYTDNWGPDRYWALGRHYGLKTPLLDWSASAFIALFFAFHENGFNDLDRSLYALNASIINREFCRRIGNEILQYSELKESFERNYDFNSYEDDIKEVMIGSVVVKRYDSDLVAKTEWYEQIQSLIAASVDEFVRLISPKMGDNPRLLGQRGVFTYQTAATSVEDIVERNITSERPCLIKIRVSSSIRDDVLNLLNSMNINYLSLFPDLEGAARYCNIKLQEEMSEDLVDLNINRIWV